MKYIILQILLCGALALVLWPLQAKEPVKGPYNCIPYYPDNDGDNYGDDAQAVVSCTPIPGWITVGGDCDDNNASIHPGATENCDGIDNNCNGILIEGNCPGINTGVSQNCKSVSSENVLTGDVFLNIGSVSNGLNTSIRSSFTLGQPVVGVNYGTEVNSAFGFWTRFLLTPSAPSVKASEGELAGHVQINWQPDPLSPAATSYKIYRNGSLLSTVDEDARSIVDFNVLAGQFYKYEVAGVNQFGEGYRGESLGFVNPNGVVTGQLTTSSGNPVPGGTVTLSPALGQSVMFRGMGTAFAEYTPEFPTANFTVSAWVKLDSLSDAAGIIDLGSHIGKNWWLHTLPAASGRGVKFSVGNGIGQVTELSHTFPAATASQWHNVAASYNGASLLLYVDGELIATATGAIAADTSVLFLGKRSDEAGYFKGKIDEVRLFNRQLAQTEIQMFLHQTVSAETNGLVAYWKFDEGAGSKAFDLTDNQIRLFFCGAEWSSDKPPVVNAGFTDANGFYKIEGINYGAGTTFTATPSKNFYLNQSLEFNGVNDNYANLTTFPLADSATITLTVKPFDFSSNQTLLSKASASGDNQLAIRFNSGNLEMMVGSTVESFGPLSMGFHHLAFALSKGGSNLDVTCYVDGTAAGTKSFPASSYDGLPWKLGASADGSTGHKDYFTGLIDEVVFFDTLLPLANIQADANTGTDDSHPNILQYFKLNEGSGIIIKDIGRALSGAGTVVGATWSTVTLISETLPHEFLPASRLITLNTSNTSVDQVDFTDFSTIPVSGYVRFEGTSCFQKKVEILVNGFSYVPPIITDAEGKFVADFEPGFSFVLTPKLEGHSFMPAFWELENLSAPVSGILFRNQTKRKVQGQLAGGYCRKSVVPGNGIVKVKVATLNGCYEQELQLTNPDGVFTFTGIPPDSVTVALTEHSNPVIANYFQLQGGFTLDLKMQDDTTDFLYFSPPHVELSPLDTNECGDAMLDMLQNVNTTIRVYELYDTARCYVDTALLTINNDIAALNQFDILMTNGSFIHSFRVDAPNIVPPHLKTLQVTAEVHDELASGLRSAVVLGRRPRQTSFTSSSPELPQLILRDPPGDGSFAFIEEGQTTCTNLTVEATDVDNSEGNITAHLGPDIETQVGTSFFSTSMLIDATADLGWSWGGSTTAYTSNSMETCLTTTKVISTSTDQYVVGSDMGGDVYMGGAMNFIFGITDELIFDTANCAFVLDKGLYVFPDGFATTFIYSERQIAVNIIPDLLLIGDTASAQRWQGILDYNQQLKDEAVFSKNMSFDAGVVYEESESTEVTKSVTNSYTQSVSTAFSGEFGVTFNGLGVSGGFNFSWTNDATTTNGSTTATTRTVGYTLADDDIGDFFTINVKKDKVYGTPVFDLVSGQTQCPHEPGTQPREGVDFSADKQVAVNVPMNDVAVFKLTLGNTSQSEETKFYTLEGLQENNPDGAVIRFNGLPSINVGVPYGQNVVVTMTVARGPLAFEYENLRVGYYSDCEVERADFLGIDPPAGFSKELEFDVYFLEPCSPVNLTSPLEGWVLTPSGGNILNINVAEYNKADTDLELVRVQYRPTVGDGAWINIAEIPTADLGSVFTVVPWNTQGLQDGLYEIRAITQCFSGALNPGISQIIEGRIERTPPEIFGTPEPADGVLSSGDEISITFTESIRCDQLIPADVLNNNNVGLYNTRTGDLVDALVSCDDNKIVIVPNVPNKFIENDILRVEVDSVQDLAGNKFGHEEWEFFVNRNSLRWLGNDIHEVVYEGEALTVVREAENIGGAPVAYTIEGVPDWVDVLPLEGNLSPASVQSVVFKFAADLPRGEYLDTIQMNGVLGSEPLVVNLRKLCKGPVWELDPGAFSYSMNFTVQLDIEGTLSTDEMDRVGAFVNGQLRGWAHLQYEQDIDKYLAFLTVYSNSVSGDTIDFQIWDTDECLLYGEVAESFTFALDAFVGSPLVPQVLHTNNLLLRRIPLTPGWNWISFNLDVPDKSTDNVLSSLSHPQGGLIKGQAQFSQYYLPLSQWLGSLTQLGYKSLYQYQASQADTIDLLGKRIIPDTVNIPVGIGWNWISYLPNEALHPDEALASLMPLNNDIIKGRTSFAQYVSGIGWVGNLDYMLPPNGYMLKLSNPGVLVYPPDAMPGAPGNGFGELQHQELSDRSLSIWNVDPSQFEHSMNAVAVVGAGENLLDDGDVVGAFVGSQVRGGSEALWVEPLQSWLVFLTVYANESGEELSFKYYDASAEDIHRLNEHFAFVTNSVEGSVEQPLVLTLEGTTDAVESVSEGWFEVYPNPAREIVFMAFGMKTQESVVVRVTDGMGRLVREFVVNTTEGLNMVRWDTEGITTGQYLVSLYSGSGVETRRVTVIR
ncbi:MAG: hypothetical protein RI973_953 [Bacteroidota bacterium]|jgi:hypothetical protein